MNEKERIEKFRADVAKLGLKFPGKTISEKTGYDKSTVSSYLKPDGEPSEPFLKAFYEKFGNSLDAIHGIEQGSSLRIDSLDPAILVKAILNLTESNKILASNNEKLVNRLGP